VVRIILQMEKIDVRYALIDKIELGRYIVRVAFVSVVRIILRMEKSYAKFVVIEDML
jgi:hypothetical protein